MTEIDTSRERTDVLIGALSSYGQADNEGVMCIASRQAVEEAIDTIRALAAERDALREAGADLTAAYMAGEAKGRDSMKAEVDAHKMCLELNVSDAADSMRERCAKFVEDYAVVNPGAAGRYGMTERLNPSIRAIVTATAIRALPLTEGKGK